MIKDIRDTLKEKYGVPKNPVKIMRLKCLDCCCGQEKEVEFCTVEKCVLFPWRMGKNPYRIKKIYSEETKKRLSEGMKERQKRKAA